LRKRGGKGGGKEKSIRAKNPRKTKEDSAVGGGQFHGREVRRGEATQNHHLSEQGGKKRGVGGDKRKLLRNAVKKGKGGGGWEKQKSGEKKRSLP